MKLPPCLARVGYRSRSLWLPLFLLWPLILIAFAPLLALGTIAGFFLERESPWAIARFIAGLLGLLCEVRGTQVTVQAPPHDRIDIAFL